MSLWLPWESSYAGMEFGRILESAKSGLEDWLWDLLACSISQMIPPSIG